MKKLNLTKQAEIICLSSIGNLPKTKDLEPQILLLSMIYEDHSPWYYPIRRFLRILFTKSCKRLTTLGSYLKERL